MNNKRERTW